MQSRATPCGKTRATVSTVTGRLPLNTSEGLEEGVEVDSSTPTPCSFGRDQATPAKAAAAITNHLVSVAQVFGSNRILICATFCVWGLLIEISRDIRFPPSSGGLSRSEPFPVSG